MEVFFEDVTTDDLQLHGHKMWARQLNIENEGTHLTNDASDVWILGYKTERGGTLLQIQRHPTKSRQWEKRLRFQPGQTI